MEMEHENIPESKCFQCYSAIKEYLEKVQENDCKLYGKSDIMNIYGCESNKALKILKLLFQMGKGIKVGKEYFVTKQNHDEFLKTFQGKEVII